MSERSRRLFFALWPDDGLRRRIVSATRFVISTCGGRSISAENLHITLAFLGAIPESRIAALRCCALATPTQAFDLSLGRIVFWKRQELLCLEPTTGAERMVEWVERLRDELERESFVVERRAFRPHVTLARDVPGKVEDLLMPDVLHWRVERMELIESTVGASGSVYRLVTRDW